MGGCRAGRSSSTIDMLKLRQSSFCYASLQDAACQAQGSACTSMLAMTLKQAFQSLGPCVEELAVPRGGLWIFICLCGLVKALLATITIPCSCAACQLLTLSWTKTMHRQAALVRQLVRARHVHQSLTQQRRPPLKTAISFDPKRDSGHWGLTLTSLLRSSFLIPLVLSKAV